jgi:predicted nucleotidyltransferase component of viral defense system
MILHKNEELFKELILATAQELGLPSLYIEKDYWVTYILKSLSKSEYNNRVIFKGGTALSKADKIIERFSEDIDLAIITQGLGSNQIKKLIKKVESAILDDNFNSFHLSSGGIHRKFEH